MQRATRERRTPRRTFSLLANLLTGDHPRLLATIAPHHSGQLASLWRRAPHRAWTKVAMIWINAKGHMRWEWTPQPGDARRWHPWRFQYRLAGHGRSDVVRIWVSRPEI